VNVIDFSNGLGVVLCKIGADYLYIGSGIDIIDFEIGFDISDDG
jgi:hypothetical protein